MLMIERATGLLTKPSNVACRAAEACIHIAPRGCTSTSRGQYEDCHGLNDLDCTGVVVIGYTYTVCVLGKY